MDAGHSDPDSTSTTTQSTTSLEDRLAALATDFRSQQMQLDVCKQAIEKQQADNAALRAELESRQLETKASDAVTQPVQEHDLNPRDTSYWSLNAMGALLPSIALRMRAKPNAASVLFGTQLLRAGSRRAGRSAAAM
jgi:DNA-binding NarL/FixJ family response regulator